MMLRTLMSVDVVVGALAAGTLLLQELAQGADCGTWQTLAVFLLGMVLPAPSRWRGPDGRGEGGTDGKG